jgi:hypothetical protein
MIVRAAISIVATRRMGMARPESEPALKGRPTIKRRYAADRSELDERIVRAARSSRSLRPDWELAHLADRASEDKRASDRGQANPAAAPRESVEGPHDVPNMILADG